MSKSPKELLERITDVGEAWANLRPTKSFAGMTLDQYREQAIKPSLDARAAVAASESRLASDTATRIAVDEVGSSVVARVVSGVKADAEEGEDGELYAAMGFTRKSHRKTGLTRRRKANGAAEAAVVKPKEVDVS